MDPNLLLRMQTSPGRAYDHANSMRSPFMASQSAPADMIKISFDQIYRSTPVNPILAQQLRRQQQQQQQQQQQHQPISMFPGSSPSMYPSPIGHTQYPPVYPTAPYVSPSSIPAASIYQSPPTTIYQSPSTSSIIRPSSSPYETSFPSPWQVGSSQQLTTAPHSSSFSNSANNSFSRPESLPPSSDSGKVIITQAHDTNSVQVTMPPPPPVMGGSRSRRAASSSVDSLVAMKNIRDIPTAFVPASTTHHIPGSSQSSLVTTNDSNSVGSANDASHNSPIRNSSPSKQPRSNPASSRRRSIPPQPERVQTITSPSAPKIVTRRGRVSKPVHRIIEDMDNPVSRTSYSKIRRLSYDSDDDDSFQTDSHLENVTAAVSDLLRNSSKPAEAAPLVQSEVVKKNVNKKRKDLNTKEDTSAKSSRSDTNLSAGEKLRAMIAEADETLAAGTGMGTSATAHSVSANVPIKKQEKPWMPTEVVALYAVYNKTDVTLPNFWKIISEKLQKDKNVLRSEEECKEKWFAALVDMNKRQEKMMQKKKQSQVENALQKLQSINEQTAVRLGAKVTASSGQQSLSKKINKRISHRQTKREDDQMDVRDDRVEEDENEEESDEQDNEPGRVVQSKRFRLGKNDLKALAEHASKATREDDIFESESFRNKLQQQQLQKKESAVARYLQQQKSILRSPALSTQHRFSSLENTPTSTLKIPLPSNSSPGMGTTKTLAATLTPLENTVNTLAVRRKSEMSSTEKKQQSASNNLLDFSPVSTPKTTKAQPLRQMLPKSSLSSEGASAVIGNGALGRYSEVQEEEDLFQSRVIQKLKRVRHHHLQETSSFATKKTKKSKQLSSVTEISKQINQEMRKVKRTFDDDDDEEEEVEEDDEIDE